MYDLCAGLSFPGCKGFDAIGPASWFQHDDHFWLFPS
jgi:hypothetical protein